MADWDEFRWLLSEAAAPWLRRASALGEPSVAEVSALRRDLGAARAGLVLDQAALRRRGRTKFAAAERMFFQREALEQATDEIVARYKASRHAFDGCVVDLCCGIGGDAIGLAGRGDLILVDRDVARVAMAEANIEAQGQSAAGRVWPAVGYADCVFCKEIAAWHIDPARRSGKRRTVQPEHFSPGPEAVERWLAACPRGAMKLAPATAAPAAWEDRAEWEWISRGGECKQLVAWFGELAGVPGRRRATIVSDDGSAEATIVGDGHASAPICRELGRYLYEADAAVVAAELVGAVAERHGLEATCGGASYLSGDRAVDDPLLRRFEVEATMPLDRKRLKAYLAKQNAGTVVVKKRGVSVDPEALTRELRGPGDGTATVLVFPLSGSTVAAVARRC